MRLIQKDLQHQIVIAEWFRLLLHTSLPQYNPRLMKIYITPVFTQEIAAAASLASGGARNNRLPQSLEAFNKKIT